MRIVLILVIIVFLLSGCCDKECRPACEGDVSWEMKCSRLTGKCVRDTATDCSEQEEKVGDVAIPRTCQRGICAFDNKEINKHLTETNDTEVYDALKNAMT